MVKDLQVMINAGDHLKVVEQAGTVLNKHFAKGEFQGSWSSGVPCLMIKMGPGALPLPMPTVQTSIRTYFNDGIVVLTLG